MTSSTPELRLLSAGRELAGEVAGRGDLEIELRGQPAGAEVTVRIGRKEVSVHADAAGTARLLLPGLLGESAGRLEVCAGDLSASIRVRPSKLSAARVAAMVDDLERWRVGAAQDDAGTSSVGRGASREAVVDALDHAVGLAAAAAAGIRRRPITRVERRMAAVRGGAGPRNGAEARWLAVHPAAAARCGSKASVRSIDRADPLTLENRGALAAFERISSRVGELRDGTRAAVARIESGRAEREAFLTERGSLWTERDAPRIAALERRIDRLERQLDGVTSARRHSGLSRIGPSIPQPVRTPRIDAHPDYWRLWRADGLAAAARATPAIAPLHIDSLDLLWERWTLCQVVDAVADLLGPPSQAPPPDEVLRGGERWRWGDVTIDYEPCIEFGDGDPRKLVPGRPWRPDIVLTVDRGSPRLHLFDAKHQRGPSSGPPWDALREIAWKYGDTIGGPDGLPSVFSVWVLWPGSGRRTLSPAMLDEAWPDQRLRAGCVGLLPGDQRTPLRDLLMRLGVMR